VDNLKRGEEEVTNLMNLFKKVLQRWTQPDGLAHELQVRINHFGERELLGDDVLAVLDNTLPMTKGYTM
jgi:undecaprenyl pyrophosphate synthase